MLSLKQLRFALRPYAVCCYFGLLPYQINLKVCHIELQRSAWRWFVWKLLFLWINIRAVLFMWKGLVLVSQPKDDYFHFFPFILLGGIAPVIIGTTAYLAFVKYSEVTLSVFNALSKGE